MEKLVKITEFLSVVKLSFANNNNNKIIGNNLSKHYSTNKICHRCTVQ